MTISKRSAFHYFLSHRAARDHLVMIMNLGDVDSRIWVAIAKEAFAEMKIVFQLIQ